MTVSQGVVRIAPPWVQAAKTSEEQIRRHCTVILRQCAAWYHPSGSVQALSRGLGLGPRTLGAYIAQGRLMPAALAIRIEQKLGRHVVRREDFRPDLFLTNGSPSDTAPADEIDNTL